MIKFIAIFQIARKLYVGQSVNNKIDESKLIFTYDQVTCVESHLTL